MREKSEASGLFKQFQKRCKTDGKPVKAVRFDNRGEFASRKLVEYLKEQGLLSEPTAPYSPESNGLAERTNGTLLCKARVMLEDAGLSKHL